MLPLHLLSARTLSLMPLKILKGKKQSCVRANVMPGIIDSVLDCPKGFSNFTTKEMILFTALTFTLTCKSFKYSNLNPPLKALYQSLRVVIGYTTDLPYSVQQPQDGIPQATTDVSTESITSRSVQAPAATGFKKTESKIHYDDCT